MKHVFKGLLLALVGCFGGLLSAEQEGSYTYTLYDGGATITGFDTFVSGDIKIPDTLGGYPVTTIGPYAFADCSMLTSVEVPESVTAIEAYAFSYCTALTSITLPDGLTSIGDSTFMDCSSLISIVLPDSITSVGNSVFSYCESLTSIKLSANMTSIGTSMFFGCYSLTSVELPDRVTSIGDCAFSCCYSLASIELPKSLTTISTSMFYACTSLASIKISDGLTSIGERAFYNCESLVSIELPNSVISIGSYAFMYCTSLTLIEIPASVSVIGQGVFEYSNRLNIVVDAENPNYASENGALFNKDKSVLIRGPGGVDPYEYIIPEGVTTIGESAFYGFSSLTSIVIPASVRVIEQYAFGYCCSLRIVVDAENPNYASENGALFNKDKSVLMRGPGGVDPYEYIIPEGVITINEAAFYGCNLLTFVRIPNSVTTIETDAFYDCVSLTSVAIPDSVTSIGAWAFGDCSALASVEMSSGVTSIGAWAFAGCTALKSIELPDGVTTIGEYMFARCSSLTSIELSASVTEIASYAFYYCNSITSIVIPENVTSIDDCAFYGCEALNEILFEGPPMLSMGYSVFLVYNGVLDRKGYYLGTYLDEWEAALSSSGTWNDLPMFLRDSVTADEQWYYNITGEDVVLTSLNVPPENGELQIPESVEGQTVITLGKKALQVKNEEQTVKTLYIPKTITTIGEDAFLNRAMAIVLDAANEHFRIENHTLFNRDKTRLLFINNTWEGEIYTIPEDVTTLDNRLFATHPEIKTIVSPIVPLEKFAGWSGELLYNGERIQYHGRELTEDETWRAGVVHVIYGDISIASGVTLTIEPEAIVKFCDDAVLTTEDDSASIVAYGAVFTPIADDTAGGDTNQDKEATQPAAGAYTLAGNILKDEATQILFPAPPSISGTLSTNTTWRRNVVYHVMGNVTIPSGVTLTIEPGAIVKMGANCSINVSSGGKLEALGTRAAPIVFTSLKDDTYGCDSNGDGKTTRPQPGDWDTISVAGTANLQYTYLYYGAPYNETGLIETTGSGSLLMNGCIVAHGKYDGVWNWGGTVDVRNTVIMDVGNAAAPYRGTNTYTNCIFTGVNYAAMCWSHWYGGTFRNCIVSGCGIGWVDANGGTTIPTLTKFSNCVFYSPEGYTLSAPNVIGQNGNVWGEPKFVDPDKGDFRIQEGSAAIDMADGSIAPEVDVYGQPRMDIVNVEDAGKPSANGAVPDAGVYEMMPRNATADVDFAVVDVAVSESAIVGDEIAIAWTVQNLGPKAIDGSWRDAFYLTNEQGAEVELGMVETSGYIAPGSTKSNTCRFTLPPMVEGDWTLKVVVNALRDIYEGSLTANNVAFSTQTLSVTVPTLTETSMQYELTPGMWGFYRIPAQEEGSSLVIRGTGVQSFVSVTPIFGRPDTTQKTIHSIGLKGGWFYFENKGPVETQVSVELRRQILVNSVSPQLITPNAKDVTLTLRGVGFSEDMVCRLVGTETYTSDSVTVVSPTEARVYFSEISEEDGSHLRLELACNGEMYALEDAVTAELDLSLDGLKAELYIPSAVRSGRAYEGVLSYLNTTNRVLPVPLFKIYSQTSGLAHSNDTVWANEIFAVGLGNEDTPGVLQPGEGGRLTFRFNVGLGGITKIEFATVKTKDGAPRNSLFTTYSELTRALSVAVTELSTTYRVRTYNALPYLSWAMAHKVGEKDGVLAGQLLLQDATPCANMRVCLKNVNTQEETVIVTDAEGYFRVDELCRGTYTVVADWLQSTDSSNWVIDGCLSNVQIVCTPKGKLYGIVKDEHGSPVPNVTVQGVFDTTIINTTTDNNGAWTLLGEFTTVGVLAVTDASGLHASVAVETEALPLASERSIAIVAPARGAVSGTFRMLSPIEQPVQNATITFVSSEHTYSARSATDGTFEVGEMLPGVYTLEVQNNYSLQGDASITIKEGVTSNLDVYANLENPLASFLKLQVVDEVATYALAPELIPHVTDCLWDFDNDGEVDASGVTVDYAYSEKGSYKPSVTYTVNEERMTWEFDEEITVGGTVTFKPNVHSLIESLGWRVDGREANSVTVAAIDGNTTKINVGDYLLVWGGDASPSLKVTSVIEDGTTFICAVEEVAFSQTFEQSVTPFALGNYQVCNRIGNPVNVNKSFSVSYYRTSDNRDHFETEEVSLGGNVIGVVNATLTLSGEMALWSDVDLVDFYSSLTATLRVDATAGVALNLNLLEKEVKLLGGTINIGGVPVVFGCEVVLDGSFSANAQVHTGIEVSGGFELFVSKHTGIDPDSFENDPVITKPTGSVSGSLDASLGVTFSVGVGAEAAHVKATFLEFEITPTGTLSAGFAFTTDQTVADQWSYSMSVGAPITVKFLNVEAFGIFSWTGYEKTWPNKWVSLSREYTSVMPDFSYTTTPADLLLGEARFTPKPIASKFQTVSSREWELDMACVYRENPATDRGVDVDIQFPVLTSSDANESGDWYQGVVRLKHYIVPQKNLSGKDKWMFLPSTWKVKEETVKFFSEKAVTEPSGDEESDVPQSCDPNEISGPMGEGAQRFVSPGDWLTYTVYFENKPDATGSAQEVKITHNLDEELDWSTFELIDVAYHNQIESGLAGKASGVAFSDLHGTAYKVRTEATLDETTGQAYWYLRIYDETTSDTWPKDAYAGLLPPNNDAHEGEGHVTYRVKVRDDARYGARIDSTATIIFDYNEPIETDPSWWNTVGHATSELPEVLLTPVYVDGAEGTLAGAKTYKVGQKASLKATPAKGSVFAGWYLDAACALPYNEVADYRTPSLSVPMEPIKLKLWARFIPATQDTLAITYEPTAVSVGDTVAQTVTVESGSLPKVTVKGLPKGLKFDAKTLIITGKPTTPGIYTVSFSATNTTIKKPAVTKTVQFRVNNIRSAALPDLNYDGVYSLCVPGGTSYTLDIPSGWTVKGLPAGMKWDAKTQSLSGAPTKPGFYTVTLTKKDGTTTETATITVEVLPFPTLTLTAIGTGEGTVKGGGDFAANKKVTLKATPAKGSVFAGWFADPEGTTPVVSTVDYRTPSLPYVMTEVDTTLYARFVPAAEDTLITITADLPIEDAGVALTIPLDVTSYSLPKLTVKNLPKGLKYDAKTLTLTGAVTTPGTYTFTVAGTNATIKKATDATTATFTLQVLNRNDLIPDSSYDKDGTWTNVAAGELLDGVIFHEALVGTTVKGLPKGLKWDAATGTLSGTTWVYGTVTLTFTNKQKETTDITLDIAPPPEPTFSELGIWDDEMADYILIDRDDEATVSAGVPVEMLFSVKAGIGPTPPTVKVTGLPNGLRASQKKQDDTVYVTLKGTTKTIGNAEILVTATDLAKRTFTQLYHLLLTPTE